MVEDEASRKETIKSGESEKTEKVVWIVNAKSRFGANGGAFKAMLTSKSDVDRGKPLMFRRNAIPIEMTPEAKQKSNKPLLEEVFKTMDFGAFGNDLTGDE